MLAKDVGKYTNTATTLTCSTHCLSAINTEGTVGPYTNTN